MWVKSSTGSLLNLSRVSEITVDRCPIDNLFRIHAWHGQPGEHEPRSVLAEYATEEEAKRHMKGLRLMVGGKACELSGSNTKGES